MSAESQIRRLSEKLSIDLEHECLIHKGQPLELAHRRFAVVKFLYNNWPKRYRATDIIEAVWEGTNVEENSVHQMARRIHQQFKAWGILDQIDIDGKHGGYCLTLPKLPGVNEQIERVVLTDVHAIALGVSGAELWTFRFPARLQQIPSAEMDWRVQRIDLYRNGDTGVLIAARFRQPGPPDTLFYFSSNGELRWAYEAAPNLMDRGGRRFEQAWRFTGILAVSCSRGNEIWASLANDAGWAGCVLSIDHQGNAIVQFANSGFVERLAAIEVPSGSQGDIAIVVAGETNAFERAFVALLGVDDPPSRSAPGERYPRYRFENAPSNYPRKYILFPNTELIEVCGHPYGHVLQLPVFPGRVLVEVATGPGGAFLRYHFSEALVPQYVFPSGNLEYQHRFFEDEKKLNHTWLECPERSAPLTLEIWERNFGWSTQQIPWRDDPWKETRPGA